jgi:hypothetical protein
VFSGTPLLVGNATADLTSPIFLSKLTLILLAVTTTRRLQKKVFAGASTGPAAIGSQHATMLASLTIGLWTAAMIAGRLSEYPYLLGIDY